MILYREALAQVLAKARPLPPMRVPLRQSLGYYLARDVVARESIPLFDQSAVDGYGLHAADLEGIAAGRPARLPLAGEVPAGSPTHRTVVAGKAIRIFTGAPIPRGVDTVVMKEDCKEEGGAVLIQRAIPLGANIRRQGEEFGKGTRVLTAGTRITPPVVGLLATLGCARPSVHRKPRVALITTGNELREPGERLKAGQIRDSNAYALAAALEALGIESIDIARVRDDREAIRCQLAGALKETDVVITVGGISVGDYDHVKAAAAEVGVKTVYWKVAIKPGRPNFFGTYSQRNAAVKKLVFGLPGNPVAALLSFHQLVRPALLKMAGASQPQPLAWNATLTTERRKKPGRLEWVRGVLTTSNDHGLTASATTGQESHMLGGLAAANCLIDFPADSTVLALEESVHVQWLTWEAS